MSIHKQHQTKDATPCVGRGAPSNAMCSSDDQMSKCLQEAEACDDKRCRYDAGCCTAAAALTDGASASHCMEATGMHALCCRCAALHHAVHAGNNACAVVLVKCIPISQDLEIERDSTVGADSLASMPTSLRRLTLAHCDSVPASSLASIGRLLVLEELTLDSLPHAGGDDALQQLALHLPAGLTSLEFTGFTSCKVSALLVEGASNPALL